jgi:hypothetical protein
VALLDELESVLTDLFSEIPVVADTAARGAGHFSPMSAVPLVAAVVCLDAMHLRKTTLVR